MNIAVVGTGYVGLVTGVCFADSGNDVVCVDIDEKKVEMLRSGGVPIYEPGLDTILKQNIEDGRISFTTDIAEGIKEAQVVFIAVGTPMKEYGEANLEYVFNCARDIGRNLNGYKVIVDKSTVPVGTADKVRDIIKGETKEAFDIVSNPEFLKEGAAINDFLYPDRVVIGGDCERAIGIMRELYEPFLRTFHPLIVMDIRSAEMTKYASNCFLATKISFINEMANLCHVAGADITLVREGMGADRRIGYEFLFPGVGYGGSCFPKDVQALIHTGGKLGLEMELMKAVESVNERQKSRMIGKMLEHYQVEDEEGALAGKTVALWGLSFKPNTDDMREAPSIVMIEKLLRLGATVRATDPEAIEETKHVFGDKIAYFNTNYEAAEGADAVILVTEWNEYRRPSWKKIKENMNGNVIFDGRNIYPPKRVREEGFVYYGIGR